MAEQELSTKKPTSIKEVVIYIDELLAKKEKTGVQAYIDSQDGIMTDKDRIERLELLVSRLAVMTGQGNLLPEYGIERWVPGKKDMNKFA